MVINNSTYPAVFRWRPACWMRVTGDDAASFLQGQFTNDLRLLDREPAVYGLWLTLKGKVQGDSFVLRGKVGEFWIGSYFTPAATIRERLESHIIADDVQIDDVTDEWAGISLLAERFQAPPGSDEQLQRFVFPGRRDGQGGTEWVYRLADGDPAEVSVLNASVLDAQAMELRRIAARIPAIPSDVGPSDLPNEAALESDAISYTKGCYLGQEVMARLKSMGQVRRRLLPVRGLTQDWPKLPAPVFAGARQVGELRSAVRDGSGGWIGLAMLSLMHVTPQLGLSFSLDGTMDLQLEGAA